MSFEQAMGQAAVAAPPLADAPQDDDYWYSLINEKAAADFLNVTDRTMQKYRQTGDGAPYIFISSRCLRYRRADLREWAEVRMRQSTSDTGKQAA